MRRQILSAGAYSITSYAVAQALRFIGNLILAKLLSPGAFGLVAVVNLLLLAINLLFDIGLSQVAIQRPGELSRDFLNTVWMIQIGRGFVVCGIAIMGALGIWGLQLLGYTSRTTAYADPALPLLVIGASSSALFQGLESTKLISLRRDLKLGRIMVIGIITQVSALGIMVTLARLTRSPWSLVAGGVTAALLQCLLSHFWLPGENNRRYFDSAIAKEVLRKSRWVMTSSFIMLLGGNGDVIMLGALIDKIRLGNYVVALQLSNVVQLLVNTLSGNVIFPALSALRRTSSEALERGYTKIQLVSDAMVVTAAGILATSGEAIVHLLFDRRYELAGHVLRYLSIGVVGLRYYVIEQQINADGNFRLNTMISCARLALLAGATYIGFRIGGLSGAAIAVGSSSLVIWPVLLWYRAKHIGFRWIVELAAVGYLLVGLILGVVLSKAIYLFRP